MRKWALISSIYLHPIIHTKLKKKEVALSDPHHLKSLSQTSNITISHKELGYKIDVPVTATAKVSLELVTFEVFVQLEFDN